MLLPEEERNELAALRFLSDAALWTIAREQMPQAQQARMEVLMTGNNFGTLTDPETQELHAMVEEGNRLMLRKAQAMALLTERGQGEISAINRLSDGSCEIIR